MKLDDSWEFETFRIIAKYYEHPQDLILIEKKRLKELGIEVE